MSIMNQNIWIKGQLLSTMTCQHIKNARIWLNNRIKEHSELGYATPIYKGICATKWFQMLTDEENRRIAVRNATVERQIELLKIKTMSDSEKRKKAAKLLENPTKENLEKARELLQNM